MKLTLSSFLYNTLKSKLKPRHGNDLRNGKRKKTKVPQQGKEKRKQVGITKVKVGISYKQVSASKARNRSKRNRTEITHSIVLATKISGDHEERGSRGRSEKLKSVRDIKRKISAG